MGNLSSFKQLIPWTLFNWIHLSTTVECVKAGATAIRCLTYLSSALDAKNSGGTHPSVSCHGMHPCYTFLSSSTYHHHIQWLGRSIKWPQSFSLTHGEEFHSATKLVSQNNKPAWNWRNLRLYQKSKVTLDIETDHGSCVANVHAWTLWGYIYMLDWWQLICLIHSSAQHPETIS